MARFAASVLALLSTPAPVFAVRLHQTGSKAREVSAAVAGVSAHRPLCDAAIVSETCGLFVEDGNATSVAAEDIQAMLSATPASASSFWARLGLGGRVDCAELCQKVTEALERVTVLPPSSDVGCYRLGDRILCDIDLDPVKVMEDARFEGDLPDFHDREVRALALSSGEEAPEPAAEVAEAQAAGIEYDVEALTLRVANLFRIFPAPNVSVTIASTASSLAEVAEATGNQQQFQRANAEARRYVDNAIRMFNARQGDNVVARWFGTAAPTTASTRQEIQRVLNSVNAMLGSVQFVYPGRQCSPNTYAYVFPRAATCTAAEAPNRACTRNTQGQFIFYMCELTLRVPMSEQIETMTHEGSHHSTAFTDDVVYGRSQCQNLARTQPARALRNADNFCYYIQDKTDR